MATRPRIFVSHSSNDQALTEAVCQELKVVAGNHPGFEVLVDFSWLRPGTEWAPQVHAMMGYCHTALILVTPHALARPEWVVKETYILSYRHALDPGFRVFWVRFDGVDNDGMSKAGYGPSHLDQIQRIGTTTARDIAAQIRREIPGVPDGATPFEQLVESLKDNLKGIGDVLLTIIGDRLGTLELPWIARDQRQRQLEQIAGQLLGVDTDRPGTYRGLTQLFSDLRGTSATEDALRKILRWVAPYWVSRNVTATLHGLLAGGDAGRWWSEPPVVNGLSQSEYIAKMYLHRTLPLDFAVRIVGIESASGGDYVEHCTRQICRAYSDLTAGDRAGVAEPLSAAEQDEIVAALRVEPPWLFVRLPLPEDRSAFAGLQARFPRVRFLVFTERSVEEIPVGSPLVSLPDLDLTVIERRRGDYRVASQTIR